jgi:hypothetical protein
MSGVRVALFDTGVLAESPVGYVDMQPIEVGVIVITPTSTG